jgi:hypothetical protein
MSQGQVPLRKQALNLLADSESWVERSAFDALSTCRPAVDDVLADLVIEGQADFRQYVGYRLAGGPLLRKAVRRLRHQPKLRRVAVWREHEQGLAVGIAERRALSEEDTDESVFAYGLNFPPEPDPAKRMEPVAQLEAFCAKGSFYEGEVIHG